MSGGYGYGDPEPTDKCPYCDEVCYADFVDIGIGNQQCGPYHCESCGASQIGPYDEPRELTSDEQRTRWYAPDSEPGSSANVIGGKVVSHVEMREVYRAEYPESGSDKWKAEIRKQRN